MGHADSASQYINLPFMSRNILGLMARLFWSFSPFLSGVEKLLDAAGVCYKRHTPVGQSGLLCPFLFSSFIGARRPEVGYLALI